MFENNFAKKIGCKYAVAVPSGTVALYLGLMAQGFKSRDEVITTNYTSIGTAHAAYMMGGFIPQVSGFEFPCDQCTNQVYGQ